MLLLQNIQMKMNSVFLLMNLEFARAQIFRPYSFLHFKRATGIPVKSDFDFPWETTHKLQIANRSPKSPEILFVSKTQQCSTIVTTQVNSRYNQCQPHCTTVLCVLYQQTLKFNQNQVSHTLMGRPSSCFNFQKCLIAHLIHIYQVSK